MNTPEDNKKLVLAFINESLHGAGPETAFDTYCSPAYKQHNPRLVDGRDGFIQFATTTEGMFEVKRTGADGDLVWLHSDSTGFRWPDEPKTPSELLKHAWMDIFRVEDGKIVEHWDVYQAIPSQTANGNPMV